ncbi:unnamed protein product [Orchesella dallaii]|uniref:BTB domain-containing protein n=1 Tax=Orchesella dallaii TaxID=48710 RepID=A0ABP1RU50_9HEXA
MFLSDVGCRLSAGVVGCRLGSCRLSSHLSAKFTHTSAAAGKLVLTSSPCTLLHILSSPNINFSCLVQELIEVEKSLVTVVGSLIGCSISFLARNSLIMATGALTKKAYLLKKGEVCLHFGSPTRSSERVLLYSANVSSFTCFQDETYDEQQIPLVSEAIRKSTELGINKPKIEMYCKYDTFYDTPRIYTNVSFPEEFEKTLSSILQKPRISIKGTYRVVRQENVVPPRRFEIYPPPMSGLPYSRGILPHLDAHEGSLSRSHFRTCGPGNNSNRNWAIVDQEVEFSVEGLELKENVTYEGFNGIEHLAQCYNSGGITNVQMTYSVILEWKEFEIPDERFEASVLDKLFEGKPLADCVLEASNKVEFECHQNILGANSEVLLRMFESGMQESQTNRIKMEDMSEKAVKMMLDYMYRRNLNLEGRTEGEILELLKAAHKYNISKLELIISRFLWYKPKEWFTMDGVLALYFFAKNVDDLRNLVEKLKAVMKANTQELSASATYKEWMEVEPQMASQFVVQLLEPERRYVNSEIEVGGGNEEHLNVVVEDDIE